jgi:hypothetical protein
LVSTGRSFILNGVFERLREAVVAVESATPGAEFARSDKYGYVTSCPSKLGTGMRASVHLKIPNLASDGTAKAAAAAAPLGLSVRSVGGERTAAGADGRVTDGTVDLSPSSRLFVTEAEIITKVPEEMCRPTGISFPFIIVIYYLLFITITIIILLPILFFFSCINLRTSRPALRWRQATPGPRKDGCSESGC